MRKINALSLLHSKPILKQTFHPLFLSVNTEWVWKLILTPKCFISQLILSRYLIVVNGKFQSCNLFWQRVAKSQKMSRMKNIFIDSFVFTLSMKKFMLSALLPLYLLCLKLGLLVRYSDNARDALWLFRKVFSEMFISKLVKSAGYASCPSVGHVFNFILHYQQPVSNHHTTTTDSTRIPCLSSNSWAKTCMIQIVAVWIVTQIVTFCASTLAPLSNSSDALNAESKLVAALKLLSWNDIFHRRQ